MPSTPERRRFWRSGFHAPAHVKVSGRAYPLQLEDVSLKGALLVHEGQWDAHTGQQCVLQIELAPDASIEMNCVVAHLVDRHIGLCCEQIDLDSITHLRQLVERNAADPALLDRDLAMLIGGH